MGRPTISDLACAAGVSVSTVNRILGDSGKVRQATMQRVMDAAEEIGFYGLGAIRSRVADTKPRHRFGVLLQGPTQVFYKVLAGSLTTAAKAVENSDVRLRIEYLEDLSPDSVAARILKVGAESDAVAVVAAEHPLVSDAIDKLGERGVPVIALVSPLSGKTNVGYVGLDNWKVGRTAAWAFDHICERPGTIATLVGTHRYRGHHLNESGFRSYFRENASEFALLEAVSTFESDAIARELTEELLRQHPDLKGLYVSGGGIGGAMAALRDSGRAGGIVTVGYDLTEPTKAGLLDDTLTLVISHPFEALAREAIAAMTRAKESGPSGGPSVLLPFDIWTRENI